MTDLTGTTWLFNESADFRTTFSYSINFTDANGEPHSSLSATHPNTTYKLMYGAVYAATSSMVSGGRISVSWYEEYYRTITITGGTDVTNADLIDWIETNATQVTSSQKTYIGVGNQAKAITNMYVGVNGVAKKITKAYIGVNGQAKKIF